MLKLFLSALFAVMLLPAAADYPIVPAGTEFLLRLEEPIGPAARDGATFRATLAADLVVGGRRIAPRGASAAVRVVSVPAYARIDTESELALTMAEIAVGGSRYAVATGYAQHPSDPARSFDFRGRTLNLSPGVELRFIMAQLLILRPEAALGAV